MNLIKLNKKNEIIHLSIINKALNINISKKQDFIKTYITLKFVFLIFLLLLNNILNKFFNSNLSKLEKMLPRLYLMLK